MRSLFCDQNLPAAISSRTPDDKPDDRDLVIRQFISRLYLLTGSRILRFRCHPHVWQSFAYLVIDSSTFVQSTERVPLLVLSFIVFSPQAGMFNFTPFSFSEIKIWPKGVTKCSFLVNKPHPSNAIVRANYASGVVMPLIMDTFLLIIMLFNPLSARSIGGRWVGLW